MSEVVKKPLKITETVLRDAHQSLIATRMTTEQMLPIVDKMDKVGYNAVECWGGATFDACLRFLKEDPWDRLRKLRDGFKNTKLQMLFRGQNILGYRPYADDVVEYFVQKSIANGIDIIRIFDCLNDIRNLQTAVTACNKEKGHAQVALSYTLGDAYTLDYWMDMAKRVEDMGADSLCIKDMAGLLVPAKATELVQALKDSTSLPVELHTHYTSGVASMTYMKAVEAGVDIIDTAMSPFALGTSQPATEVMVEAFKGTEFDTGLDLNLLSEIADYFRPMREEALASGLMNPKVLGVNINTLRYQVPGGMLSNLISQLKEQGKEDKYEEVLAEVPRVRKDLGEPPLVTPSSQIVGTQAVFNVLMGERYKMVTKETKDILLGKYGATVKPFNPEVQKKCIGDTTPITCRPADLLEDELDKLESEMAQYKEQDEDVLTDNDSHFNVREEVDGNKKFWKVTLADNGDNNYDLWKGTFTIKNKDNINITYTVYHTGIFHEITEDMANRYELAEGGNDELKVKGIFYYGVVKVQGETNTYIMLDRNLGATDNSPYVPDINEFKNNKGAIGGYFKISENKYLDATKGNLSSELSPEGFEIPDKSVFEDLDNAGRLKTETRKTALGESYYCTFMETTASKLGTIYLPYGGYLEGQSLKNPNHVILWTKSLLSETQGFSNTSLEYGYWYNYFDIYNGKQGISNVRFVSGSNGKNTGRYKAMPLRLISKTVLKNPTL